MARSTKRKTRAAPKRRRRLEIVELAEAAPGRADTSPVLTGGDVDADWSRAHMAGDEAAGERGRRREAVAVGARGVSASPRRS